MSQWTACDGQLGAMGGSAMDGLAMDGLAMNVYGWAMDGYDLAIKRCTARQCHNGGLGDDALAR